MVSDLVNQATGQWDLELVRLLCAEASAEEILRMPTPRPEQNDCWIWTKEATSKHFVKSFVLSE